MHAHVYTHMRGRTRVYRQTADPNSLYTRTHTYTIDIAIVKKMLNLISGVLSGFFGVNDTKCYPIHKNGTQAEKTAKNSIKNTNHLTHARNTRLRTQMSNFCPIYAHAHILYNIVIVKELLNLISGVLSGFFISVYTLARFFAFRPVEIKKGAENGTLLVIF